jgi:hypothetical protein
MDFASNSSRFLFNLSDSVLRPNRRGFSAYKGIFLLDIEGDDVFDIVFIEVMYDDDDGDKYASQEIVVGFKGAVVIKSSAMKATATVVVAVDASTNDGRNIAAFSL